MQKFLNRLYDQHNSVPTTVAAASDSDGIQSNEICQSNIPVTPETPRNSDKKLEKRPTRSKRKLNI